MGRKIPMWQILIVMAFTIASLCYSMFFTGYKELHIPLICSAAFASIIAAANGYKWSFLEQGILTSINRSMQAILILLTVGILIGSWIAAGIVPAMIYYGLMILNPSVFLVAGCLICCIVSLATGSSWTTAGTIGIALIGVGQGLGMEPAITAGAIVSGAYFGDKMSPLSDTTNLAPAAAGSNLFDHIRHMVWTVVPSLTIALIIYAAMGLSVDKSSDNSLIVELLRTNLNANFNLSPILLIPPLLVVVIVALRLPALPGLVGGILLGCIFGSVFQGISLADWPGMMHYGFESVSEMGPFVTEFEDGAVTIGPDLMTGMAGVTDSYSSIDKLLTRGGMDSMLWTVNLIICAMCFGGIMDASGMLATLAQALLRLAKNTGSLVVITVLSCLFINVIAADQYLSIILPGRMYKEAWEDRRLAPKNLSRCLEDAGTVTSALIPWNTCGATMTTFLGVPTAKYFPFAFLNLLNPFISIFYGFTGISMQKLSEEEYAAILEERERTRQDALRTMEA